MVAEPFMESVFHCNPITDFAQRYCPCQSPDETLRQQIEDHLANHPHFRGRSRCIHVRVRAGVVRVQGCLPSWYLKQLLQETVRRIPGVKRISNQTSVRDWSYVCEPDLPGSFDRLEAVRPHFQVRPEIDSHRIPR